MIQEVDKILGNINSELKARKERFRTTAQIMKQVRRTEHNNAQNI